MGINSAAGEKECVEEANVGSCLGVGCFMHHGQAHCHGTTCLCDEGYCAADGRYCVRASTTTPPTTTQQWEKYDRCGVNEYFKSGSGLASTVKCTKECGSKSGGWKSWLWGDKAASTAHNCCMLQCTALAVKDGLPDCWG